MIPPAEWTAIADEHRRMHEDAKARWKAMCDLYGRDWWKSNLKAATSLLRVMGAMAGAVVVMEGAAADSAIAELLASVGCTPDGAA